MQGALFPEAEMSKIELTNEQYEQLCASLESAEESEFRQATAGIPPGILRSQQAFWRALPELLRHKRNHGQWAAFNGDKWIGTARTYVELIRNIKRQGVPNDDYYVGRIEPDDEPPWATIEVEPRHGHDIEVLPPES
jgi:hypothetical protein